jgi:hypothetical protein
VRRVLRPALICLLAIFAGCKTPPYEGRYDFYEGWRKGEVTAVQPLNEIHPLDLPRCNEARSPAAAASFAPWAVIKYFRMARLSYTSVALARVPLKIGDRVYVNPTGCPVRVVLRKVD